MKNTFKKLISVILMTAIVLSTSYVVAPVQKVDAAVSHPFLLTKASEFGELRARANQGEPWASIKTYAISKAKGSIDTSSYDRLADFLDCCALAYILDDANKATYASKVASALTSSTFTGMAAAINPSNHNYYTPIGNAYTCGVIAYDVVYNDIAPGTRSTIETTLAGIANAFYNKPNSSWGLCTWQCYGIWQVFTQNTAGINTANTNYLSHLDGSISSDGVAIIGGLYAKSRLSGSAISKQYLMDIMSYTGYHNYYTEPEVKKFYEWFYGYSQTPNGRQWVFADTPLYNSFELVHSIFKAGKFSPDAAAYAARLLKAKSTYTGGFLAYVLHTENAEPRKAPSKIFPDGGAFFYENKDDIYAQASALWNVKSSWGHRHKETNAINVANYGQTLLSNAGYLTYGVGVGNYTWNYFGERAVSGNNALINYSIVNGSGTSTYNPSSVNDHQQYSGNGVTEGIVSPLFNYASGDSGSALPNGKHIRNLVSVYPQDSPKGGYWVLFDEIDATTGGVPANIVLHPVSTAISTVSTNTEYSATCNYYKKSDGTPINTVNLSMFLGTAPTSVTKYNGMIASGKEANCLEGQYLFSSYNTDSAGKKNIVTVLFPSDSTHAKATMARISGTGYTGASINLGSSTIDYALESAGTSTITYGNATFKGLATLYREVAGANKFYFVRKGTYFKDGKYGFTAGSNASVYMRGTTGNIVSPGTSVTFYYPGVTGVKLNGSLVASTVGSNTVTVNVPAGNYTVELTTGQVPPVDPDPEDPEDPEEPEDPNPTIDADGNRIFPVKYDAYVQSGANANTQYGSSNLLIATTSTEADWSRNIYLNFGLSKLDISSIQQAKLRLYVSKADAATSRTLKLYGNSNEAWTESGTTGITWNNAPAPTTLIATYDATGLQAGTWLEFDVTNYINNHMADKKVSFELINESNIYTSFNSKEAAANQPQLVITPAQSQPVDPVDPNPDPTPTTDADGNIIVPVKADAYVQSGANANTQYGSSNLLISTTSTEADWSRNIYAKFGFSSLTQSSIYQAKLRFYVSKADAATSRMLKLYGTSKEYWTEADTVSGSTTIPGITWNNAPETVTEIASINAAGLQAGTWLEFDVTDYVNSNMDDKLVSFKLVNESNIYTSFNSKEAATNQPQLVITPVEPDTDVTVTVNPTADSFVFGGEPNTNKGTLTTMESKGGSTAYIRRPYFKFDFSTVTKSSVKSAKLRLYVYNADAAAPATPLKIFGNDVESWTETGITYNNAPAGTTQITSTNVSGSQKGTWVEFDVTSYINSQMSDKIVSLELVNDSTNWYSFYSRESNGYDPELVITY